VTENATASRKKKAEQLRSKMKPSIRTIIFPRSKNLKLVAALCDGKVAIT
jgi:hypothetical protein